MEDEYFVPWHFRITTVFLFGTCLAWAGWIFWFHAWRMLSDPDAYEVQFERWQQTMELKKRTISQQAYRDVLRTELDKAEFELENRLAELETATAMPAMTRTQASE
jgi:hypothetical protein